jgi:ABC-2 type transport system ATP-binding protein
MGSSSNVLVRVSGVASGLLTQKLAQLESARKTIVVSEGGEDGVALRVYPTKGARTGALAGLVAQLAVGEGWKLEELHTEEGRLDEVFRGITRPDTGRREKTA